MNFIFRIILSPILILNLKKSKVTKSQKSLKVKSHQKTHENTEKHTKTQKNTEKQMKTQKNTEKHRKTHENTEKHRKTQ